MSLEGNENDLVIRYRYIVFRCMKGYGLVRNLRDSDLYSVGLIGLLKAIRTFDPERGVPFAAYAYGGVRKGMSNWFVKRNRQLRMPLLGDDEAFDSVEDYREPATDILVEKADRAVLLRRVLEMVPERWRTVLWLRTVDGKTLEEIGEVLGVTRERVRQLYLNALGRIRRIIALKITQRNSQPHDVWGPG